METPNPRFHVVSLSKSASVVTFTFNPPATRWLLLLPALLALSMSWFAIRWYIGDTIAEYAPTPDQGGTDLAEVATHWAPDDPLTHWRLASFAMQDFSADNLAVAVREYELAVKAAPYDYRYWMEYGRALEASGDRDSAEKALKRAVELAPSYSNPRWYYGNLLLRQGKVDEAFQHLARAAEADPAMQQPVFALAAQVFGDDTGQTVKYLPSSTLRLQLAMNLINANKFAEAARVMKTVSEADQKAQSELTEEIMKALIDRKQFRAALSVLREIQPDPSQLPLLAQVWNPGFENQFPLMDPKPFHWMIDSKPQAQMSIDNVAHGGSKSLRMDFRAPSRLAGITASQTVVVEPDTTYQLQFYLRTEKLVSGATPAVMIADEVNGGWLTTAQPAPSGTNDWQPVTLEFRTKPTTDGISIHFIRGNCSDDPKEVCPIFGTIWYDDFNLQRIGGSGASTSGQGTNQR